MPNLKLTDASCISFEGAGVLLLGPSGSGKSDLALRLIHAGAMLVADDVVRVTVSAGRAFASPPPALAGLLELYGAGIIRLPHVADAPLALAVRLVAREAVERLPEPAAFDCNGIAIPLLSLHAFDISTPAKILTVVEMLNAGQEFVMELKRGA